MMTNLSVGTTNGGRSDQYSIDKKRLPGVTFGGTFNGKRQLQELKEYNDLLVIDIDHMNEAQITAVT